MGRVLMSYFASMYVRIITGMKIYDTTAGFKCYRRAVLETIDLDRIRFKGYAFQIEMKFTAWKLGFHIEEVPHCLYRPHAREHPKCRAVFSTKRFGVYQRMKLRSIFSEL